MPFKRAEPKQLVQALTRLHSFGGLENGAIHCPLSNVVQTSMASWTKLLIFVDLTGGVEMQARQLRF
jgi:hypothetical protein